ncbi:unnamed protein product [Symbiodinium microadriaticum]|nr:unnamed protein product [Symbiodinium microadriaticum]
MPSERLCHKIACDASAGGGVQPHQKEQDPYPTQELEMARAAQSCPDQTEDPRSELAELTKAMVGVESLLPEELEDSGDGGRVGFWVLRFGLRRCLAHALGREAALGRALGLGAAIAAGLGQLDVSSLSLSAEVSQCKQQSIIDSVEMRHQPQKCPGSLSKAGLNSKPSFLIHSAGSARDQGGGTDRQERRPAIDKVKSKSTDEKRQLLRHCIGRPQVL